MLNLIRPVLVALALMLGLAIAPAPAASAQALTPTVPAEFALAWFDPASPGAADYCESEDGAGQDVCLWDASVLGNGEGVSFYSLGEGRVTLHADGSVNVWTERGPVHWSGELDGVPACSADFGGPTDYVCLDSIEGVDYVALDYGSVVVWEDGTVQTR